LPAAAHGPEVETEEAAQNRRRKSGEPDHDPERGAHRRQDARLIERGHAAEQADDPNPGRNQGRAGGRVRRAARGAEHGERVEAEGRGQLQHVVRPVDDPSIGLEARSTHPGSVRHENPNAEFGGQRAAERQVAFNTELGVP
jgi:hypothetical protein